MSTIYRTNLQHQNLNSCDGECFDDLCPKCRFEIMSSADENDYDSSSDLPIPLSPLSKDEYTTDEVSDSDESSESEESIDEEPIKDEVQLHEELNRKSQKVSRHIESLHQQFLAFCAMLTRQHSIVTQLKRQHNHCNELLCTFEDFLVSFEEETEQYIYCGNWFAQIMLLKERLAHFDENAFLLIQHINNKMEALFDEFIEHKNQLISDQSLVNLQNVISELRFVNNRVSSAEDELDDLIDYIAVQVQEQRNLIGAFVDVMSAIGRAVEATIVCNQITEFDCFNGQHFLQEFNRTLSCIQLI